jgi:hypothetical protein
MQLHASLIEKYAYDSNPTANRKRCEFSGYSITATAVTADLNTISLSFWKLARFHTRTFLSREPVTKY